MWYVSNLTGTYRDNAMVHDLQQVSVEIDEVAGYVQCCDLAIASAQELASSSKSLQHHAAFARPRVLCYQFRPADKGLYAERKRAN
ncbi:hypothetical protein SAMN04488498_1415 [Mesorhizobium albiziae]|uniref:Uncharacterized protein n=1 Tax=Neomesorhizobium albiziae TaxID=335020 RepID=A0A1I4FAN6_9HYPH|nr:hypothetical protein GCM10007937_24880 [Mesorhizobium albiziae]SFL15062.1 hypothetical protein SAMN04488498_1415 [Mesorhizobium albiziae]